MNNMKNALFSAFLLIIACDHAYAYLDLNSGSMLLQIILGGAAGLAVAGKLFWHRIMLFLGLAKDEPINPEIEEMLNDDNNESREKLKHSE